MITMIFCSVRNTVVELRGMLLGQQGCGMLSWNCVIRCGGLSTIFYGAENNITTPPSVQKNITTSTLGRALVLVTRDVFILASRDVNVASKFSVHLSSQELQDRSYTGAM